MRKAMLLSISVVMLFGCGSSKLEDFDKVSCYEKCFESEYRYTCRSECGDKQKMQDAFIQAKRETELNKVQADVQKSMPTELLVRLTNEECDELKSPYGINWCGENYKKPVIKLKSYVGAKIDAEFKRRADLKDKSIGEYYLVEKSGCLRHSYLGCYRAYAGWNKFEKTLEEVNGYVRICPFTSCKDTDDLWIPKENIFYYKDAPSVYEKLRKKVIKKAKKLPKQ